MADSLFTLRSGSVVEKREPRKVGVWVACQQGDDGFCLPQHTIALVSELAELTVLLFDSLISQTMQLAAQGSAVGENET